MKNAWKEEAAVTVSADFVCLAAVEFAQGPVLLSLCRTADLLTGRWPEASCKCNVMRQYDVSMDGALILPSEEMSKTSQNNKSPSIVLPWARNYHQRLQLDVVVACAEAKQTISIESAQYRSQCSDNVARYAVYSLCRFSTRPRRQPREMLCKARSWTCRQNRL